MNFDKYHLSQGPFIKTLTVPGDRAKEILSEQDMYESNNRSYPRSVPLVPNRAKGAIIEDVDGNQFMDFFSLCGVVNVGHNQADVLDAIKEQMNKLIHAMDFPTTVKMNFIKNINDKLPAGLKNKVKFNFCGPSGADGVEAALKLARINSKRDVVVSFQGAYHGMTQGALSATSNLKSRKNIPYLTQGVHFVKYSYCYRCPFGKKPDSCNLECASQIKDLLENPHSGVDKPAAILIEPVQGEGGAIVPHKDFHNALRKICDDHGVLLIHDEVQVGFYRTGKLLASEHFNVTPDMVIMSKGIGGVGMPISLLLIKKEFDTWLPGTHAGTFRGNQLSMAAGNAALDFIAENAIQEHVAAMGNILMNGLLAIQKNSRFIGEVRGLGLIAGVEYVKDKTTKEPFIDFCIKMRAQLFENGILIEIGGHHSNVIRILPPLIVTKVMLDKFLELFEKINKNIEDSYGVL